MSTTSEWNKYLLNTGILSKEREAAIREYPNSIMELGKKELLALMRFKIRAEFNTLPPEKQALIPDLNEQLEKADSTQALCQVWGSVRFA